jgi:hypothetical protein
MESFSEDYNSIFVGSKNSIMIAAGSEREMREDFIESSLKGFHWKSMWTFLIFYW